MIVMLWFAGFLLGWGPFKTIHSEPTNDLHWVTNLLTLLLFGCTHSILARAGAKEWMARILPEELVRSVYVAVAGASLALVMVVWVPMPEHVWSVDNQAGRYGLMALHALGWMLVIASTFQIDHAQLFGLRQAFYSGGARTHEQLVIPWLYRWVRHPMMTGFLMVLWTIPDFSAGHALIASVLTVYILLGTRWEESDLVRDMGHAYRSYSSQVPRLVPSLRGPLPSSDARALERTGQQSESSVGMHAHRVLDHWGNEHEGDRPIVVILPAMGVPASFYEQFGHELGKSLNATVVLTELPGQGSDVRSASKGDDFGYECVVDIGLPSLVGSLKTARPARPIFLVGHSLGGQLALLSLQNIAHHVTGLILIASGAVHPKFWPRSQQPSAAAMVWSVAAISRVLPWYPGRRLGFGGDQAKRWMKDWSYSALWGKYRLHRRDRTTRTPDLKGIRTPVLALHVDGDAVAPRSALDALLATAPDIHAQHIKIEADGLGSPWLRHFNWAKQSSLVSSPIEGWLRSSMARRWKCSPDPSEQNGCSDHQFAGVEP